MLTSLKFMVSAPASVIMGRKPVKTKTAANIKVTLILFILASFQRKAFTACIWFYRKLGKIVSASLRPKTRGGAARAF
jgi:hypothetical protein